MENSNIRISRQSKATLREFADHDDSSIRKVLDEAVEQYRRNRCFQELNEGYARLQADPKAWQEELDERQLWDTAMADGLDSE